MKTGTRKRTARKQPPPTYLIIKVKVGTCFNEDTNDVYLLARVEGDIGFEYRRWSSGLTTCPGGGEAHEFLGASCMLIRSRSVKRSKGGWTKCRRHAATGSCSE